jgi:hypothetical protein
MAFFISQSQEQAQSFGDSGTIYRRIAPLLQNLHSAVSKTNEILRDLAGYSLPQHDDLTQYLDQRTLNQQHAVWVKSQAHTINIDELRADLDPARARIGHQLHDMYPDHIRDILMAEVMTKLGYLPAYEEVNLAVHRLEHFFSGALELKSDRKWQVFDNPFVHSIYSSNDVVNLSFGYTYVGRQYYNKWQYFDTELEFDDHYNYEQIEWAFQINLSRPQTIPFSREFLAWCEQKGVPPISTQIPIANVVDLEQDLTYYRTMLYRNSAAGNQATLSLS